MLTEQQLFEEFRQCAFVIAHDGAPYLDVPHALAFVDACQANDLAVLGLDGFVADRNEQSLNVRDALIVDCSSIEASQWPQFRDKANSFARGFLLEQAGEPDLVFEFVLWSAAERTQAQGRGVELDTGPGGLTLRLSPKMVKLLPRRGWTNDAVVETYRHPASTHATVDKTVRPVHLTSASSPDTHGKRRWWQVWGRG